MLAAELFFLFFSKKAPILWWIINDAIDSSTNEFDMFQYKVAYLSTRIELKIESPWLETNNANSLLKKCENRHNIRTAGIQNKGRDASLAPAEGIQSRVCSMYVV